MGLLVNTCDKDLCTDALNWNSKNAFNNARFAMEAAYQCFRISQLLKPIEITDPNISEKAIMTYISQFINLLKDKDVNKLEVTNKQLSSVLEDCGNTSLMLAPLPVDNSIYNSDYHIVITENMPLLINDRVHILVTISSEKKVISNNFIVQAIDQNGNLFPCTPTNNEAKFDQKQFSFFPNLSVIFDIIVRDFNDDKSVLNSPFQINIKKENKTIVAYGPGLYCSNINHLGIFILETNFSNQQIGFSMEGPSKCNIECQNLVENIVKISYHVSIAGEYILSIKYGESNICNSPYNINVTHSLIIQDLNKIRIVGLKNRNLQSFVVDCRNTVFTKPPEIQCFDKHGTSLAIVKIDEMRMQCYRIKMLTENINRYIIFAGYENVQMNGFPYLVYAKDDTNQPMIIENDDNSSNITEASLKVINNKLLDDIELSIRDICINSLKSLSFSHKIDKTDDVHDENLTSSRNLTQTPNNMPYKWTDSLSGLILYGECLRGLPIKVKKIHWIVVDFKESLYDGELGLAMEGPSNTKIQCINIENDKCFIKFQPMESGRYELTMHFHNQPVYGSPFAILVSITTNQCCDKFSPEFIINMISQRKISPSAITEKKVNTLINSMESMSSDKNLCCINEVLEINSIGEKTLNIGVLNQSVIKSSRLIVPSEFQSSNESISNTSSYSIPSGLYKARFRKISHFKESPSIDEKEKLLLTRNKSNKSNNDDLFSSSLSSSMEIERISQNYSDSLKSFYDNMRSAFTNLFVMEILYNVINQIINLYFPTNISINYAHIKEVPEKSIITDHTTTYYSESSLEENEYIVDNDFPISTYTSSHNILNKNSGNSFLKSFNKDKFNNLKILMSSFDGINNLDSYYEKSPEYIDNNLSMIHKMQSNKTFNTKNPGMIVNSCQRSIELEILSTSVSSNDLYMKEACDSNIEKDFVFEQSQIESKQTSEFFSAFEIPIFNRDIFCKFVTSDISSERSANLYNNHKDIHFQKTIKNSKNPNDNCNARYPKDNLINTSNHDSIYCHFFNIPWGKNPIKKISTIEDEVDEPDDGQTVNNVTTINHFMESIQNCIIIPKYNECESYLYGKDYYCINGPKLRLIEEYLHIFYNVSESIQLKKDIQPNVLSTQPEEKLKPKIYLEFNLKLEFAKGSKPKLFFSQFTKRNLLLRNNHNCQASFWKINHDLQLYEIICSDTLYLMISQIVSKCITKNKLNKKLQERSVQTSTVVLCPNDMTNITIPHEPILFPNKDIQLNKLMLADSSHYHSKHNLHDSELTNVQCSNDSQDISSAVETLVDAITDIAKNHLILHPSKSNIKRVEELIQLLPKLLKFGKEKRLYQINYLTDRLESILLQNNEHNSNKALSQIIKSVKNCVSLDADNCKERSSLNKLPSL